jgi:hypothetical protein
VAVSISTYPQVQSAIDAIGGWPTPMQRHFRDPLEAALLSAFLSFSLSLSPSPFLSSFLSFFSFFLPSVLCSSFSKLSTACWLFDVPPQPTMYSPQRVIPKWEVRYLAPCGSLHLRWECQPRNWPLAREVVCADDILSTVHTRPEVLLMSARTRDSHQGPFDRCNWCVGGMSHRSPPERTQCTFDRVLQSSKFYWATGTQNAPT